MFSVRRYGTSATNHKAAVIFWAGEEPLLLRRLVGVVKVIVALAAVAPVPARVVAVVLVQPRQDALAVLASAARVTGEPVARLFARCVSIGPDFEV